MAAPLRDASELQKQLNEFQDLQRQVQFSANQRQQLSMQIEEIKMAESELSRADKSIYRLIGPILVESSKADSINDLKERRELFEMRIGVLSKQEEKARPRLEEIRSKLEKALAQNKLSQ